MRPVFAPALAPTVWQTSDLVENHAGIRAWVEWVDIATLRAPLQLDVRTSRLPPASFDAVFSANTAHIMSWPAVTSMLTLVGQTLVDAGVFCLYGPFRFDGEFNAPSNAVFDRNLRARDPAMGIRELAEIDELAAASGMQRRKLYAMPANNNLVVWERQQR